MMGLTTILNQPVKHSNPAHSRSGPIGIFTWLSEKEIEDAKPKSLNFVVPITVLHDSWLELPARIAIIKQLIVNTKSSISIVNHSAIKTQSNFSILLRRNYAVKHAIEVLDKSILDVIDYIEKFEARRK